MTKSKYLSKTRLQVLLMMVKKAQKTVSILGTTKRMLAQDHEIHKQISWEPHRVVTYVQKKITFKIDFIPNSNATQPIICLLVSSATILSIMYTEATQANRTTFKNYQWNDSFNIA